MRQIFNILKTKAFFRKIVLSFIRISLGYNVNDQLEECHMAFVRKIRVFLEKCTFKRLWFEFWPLFHLFSRFKSRLLNCCLCFLGRLHWCAFCCLVFCWFCRGNHCFFRRCSHFIQLVVVWAFKSFSMTFWAARNVSVATRTTLCCAIPSAGTLDVPLSMTNREDIHCFSHT